MQSKYIMVNNIKTHYLECGSGEPLMLIHSGEFGASARNSWEYNMEALGEHFHVFAPDMIGFGDTEKLFHFTNMRQFRIQHIRDFMDQLCIEDAYFIGSSTGGGMILSVAAMDQPTWHIRKGISISGGGRNTKEAMQILTDYDGTFERMRAFHDLLFHDEQWKTDEYIQKRHQESIKPGAWESASAARFRSPVAEPPAPRVDQFENIKTPMLLVGGDQDRMKPEGFVQDLQQKIPHAQMYIFKNTAHNANIEQVEEFNQLAVQFFREDSEA